MNLPRWAHDESDEHNVSTSFSLGRDPKSFMIRMSSGSKCQNSTILAKSFASTLHAMYSIPLLIHRGIVAEPFAREEPSEEPSSSLLSTLIVQVEQEDAGIGFQVDGPGSHNESYTLSINVASEAQLKATTIYGAIRGLTTLTQLTHRGRVEGDPDPPPCISGLPLSIQDEPRFRWRSLLLDTANHYLPLEVGTIDPWTPLEPH